jgi:hypothetical protein
VVLDATGSICEPEDAEKEKEEEGESSEPVSLAVSPGIRSVYSLWSWVQQSSRAQREVIPEVREASAEGSRVYHVL